MTPKEKALQLFNKFYDAEQLVGYLAKKECKAYALILVDEITASNPSKITTRKRLDLDGNETGLTFTDISLDYDYWLKVRKEIEQL